MQIDPHENPQTPYERMLAVNDLECDTYACWNAGRYRRDCDGHPRVCGFSGHMACETHRERLNRSIASPICEWTGAVIVLEA